MILFRTGKTIFLIWELSTAFAIKVPHQGKKTAVVRLIGADNIDSTIYHILGPLHDTIV